MTRHWTIPVCPHCSATDRTVAAWEAPAQPWEPPSMASIHCFACGADGVIDMTYTIGTRTRAAPPTGLAVSKNADATPLKPPVAATPKDDG